MLKKDEGIILKAARSGESSKEVTFLGRWSGKIRLIAKSALKGKSAFGGVLEPGNHVEVVYYFREGRSRFYLKEVSVVSVATVDRNSLPAMASALAVLELLDRVCYPGSPDETVVGIALEYIRCQPVSDPLFFFLVFEIKLLEGLGALPDFLRCAHCGEDAAGGGYDPREGVSVCAAHRELYPQARSVYAELLQLIEKCCGEPLDKLRNQEIGRKLRKDLGKIVHWTYTYHVQGYALPESLRLL